MTWLQRIEEAEESRYFTDGDKEDAAHWKTCAVGEGREALKGRGFVFWNDGTPEDNKVFELGVHFSDAVKKNDIERARDIYNQLQALLAVAPEGGQQ